MNIFTVNQVNQVYVVTGVSSDKITNDTIAAGTHSAGDIRVGVSADGESMFFQHVGADNTISRSDLIDLKNILCGKKTVANAMRKRRKKVKVTLPSGVNSGAPIKGEDYVYKLEFTGYIGISPEDSKYWKYGVVHAVSGMTAADFYKTLAISLVNNCSRDGAKLIEVSLDGNATVVKPGMKPSDITGNDPTGVIIMAAEPDWILGTKQQKLLEFTVCEARVDFEGEDVDGTSTEDLTASAADNIIENGKLMADYEYFFHGERGDQYRLIGFPNYIPTSYLVDPSKKYDTVALHFAYVGDNQSCQKSEKDITFIVDPSVTSDLVTAINTAAGSTVVA